MEKTSLVKFESVELELLTSENGLSEVRGGKSFIITVVDKIIDFITGGDEETNGNCNCNCTTNNTNNNTNNNG